MRKVLLGVLMLVIIIGVSYIKTVREREKSSAFDDEARQQAAQELTGFKNERDSLSQEVRQLKTVYNDSLVQKDLAYQTKISSLERLLGEQDSLIDSLKNTTVEAATQTVAVKPSPPKSESKHQQILTYYKTRYKDLPGDLSAYEKKIALTEIREETAMRFSISLEELKKIREQAKLNY